MNNYREPEKCCEKAFEALFALHGEKSMLEYEQGYFKALSDISEWFEYHTEIIKVYRLNNIKGISAILNFFAANRLDLQEHGREFEFAVTKNKNSVSLEKKIQHKSDKRGVR